MEIKWEGREQYICGKLKFEGEYLNGKKWNGYGNMDFEIKNGKGKEQQKNGKFKFKGEYLNGERNGKGKEYKLSEFIFEGEYLNGKKMEKQKIIILMANQNLKENIQME